MDGPLKTLVFSSLYPNAIHPRHGVFVEERLRHLVATGKVRAKVIAPVPWFPSRNPAFGQYSHFARIPTREERYGIEILHPRYPVIPKIGMTIAPILMANSMASVVRDVIETGFRCDLIDAHYLYPDGVAAVEIGRRLKIPVLVTARGSDVNVFPRYRAAKIQILRAIERSAGVITVSLALKNVLIGLGVPHHRISVLRNGVDLNRFSPMSVEMARAQLGLFGKMWVSVGHLVASKGHQLAIEALTKVPDVTLVIIGDGPYFGSLHALANRLNVAQRVRIAGHVEHRRLHTYYSAADALILASTNEGMPNVVLEAMACGTQVIASNVGGIPEVLCVPEAGVLMRERSSDAIVKSWAELCDRGLDDRRRIETRRHAEQFSWDATTSGQLELFRKIISWPDMEKYAGVRRI